MADIELVIKLPEKTVNDIKDNAMFAGSISSEILWDVTSAIINGTPLDDVLDKIRAEIADYKDDLIIHQERNEMIDMVLDIIDKYRTKRSDKE